MPLLFAFAVNVIEPVLVPAAGDGEVMVIQEESDTVALQAHTADVFTVKLPPPPLTGILVEFGDREYAQGGGAATVSTTGMAAVRFVAVAESTARRPVYTPDGVVAPTVMVNDCTVPVAPPAGNAAFEKPSSAIL